MLWEVTRIKYIYRMVWEDILKCLGFMAFCVQSEQAAGSSFVDKERVTSV